MTEQEITDFILDRQAFDNQPGMIWLPQQRMGCGHGNDFERTVDVFGISTCKPWTRFALEIKVSRSDFQADAKNPIKQRRARLVANKFYYVAPLGLLDWREVPLWAGLAELRDNGMMRITVEAPYQDTVPPTWRFVAQLARQAAKVRELLENPEELEGKE